MDQRNMKWFDTVEKWRRKGKVVFLRNSRSDVKVWS